jgi:hypothetical protein
VAQAPARAWDIGPESWHADLISPPELEADEYKSAGLSHRVVRAFAYALVKVPWFSESNSASVLAHGERTVEQEGCDAAPGTASQTAAVAFTWDIRARVFENGSHAKATCKHKATLMPAQPGGVPHVESDIAAAELYGTGTDVFSGAPGFQDVGLYCESALVDGGKVKLYLYAEARAEAQGCWPLATYAWAGDRGAWDPIETECTDWQTCAPTCLPSGPPGEPL